MLLSKQSLADASALTVLRTSTTATAAAEPTACDTDRAIYFGEFSQEANAYSCLQFTVFNSSHLSVNSLVYSLNVLTDYSPKFRLSFMPRLHGIGNFITGLIHISLSPRLSLHRGAVAYCCT
jgi:hypothetical protein